MKNTQLDNTTNTTTDNTTEIMENNIVNVSGTVHGKSIHISYEEGAYGVPVKDSLMVDFQGALHTPSEAAAKRILSACVTLEEGDARGADRVLHKAFDALLYMTEHKMVTVVTARPTSDDIKVCDDKGKEIVFTATWQKKVEGVFVDVHQDFFLVKRSEFQAHKPFAKKYGVRFVRVEHRLNEKGLASLVRVAQRFFAKKGEKIIGEKKGSMWAICANTQDLVRDLDIAEQLSTKAHTMVRVTNAILGRTGNIAFDTEFYGIVLPEAMDGTVQITEDFAEICQGTGDMNGKHTKGVTRMPLRGELHGFDRNAQVGHTIEEGAKGQFWILSTAGSQGVRMDMQTLAFTTKDQGVAFINKKTRELKSKDAKGLIADQLTTEEQELWEAGMPLGLLVEESRAYKEAKSFLMKGYRSMMVGAGVCQVVEVEGDTTGLDIYEECDISRVTGDMPTPKASNEWVIRLGAGGKLEAMEWLLKSDEIQFSKAALREFNKAYGRDPVIGELVPMMRQPALPNGSAIRMFSYAGKALRADGRMLAQGIVVASQSPAYRDMNGDFDGDNCVLFFEELPEMVDTNMAADMDVLLAGLKTGAVVRPRVMGNQMLWSETMLLVSTGLSRSVGIAVSNLMRLWEAGHLDADGVRTRGLRAAQGSIFAMKAAVDVPGITRGFKWLGNQVRELAMSKDKSLVVAISEIKDAWGDAGKIAAWNNTVKVAGMSCKRTPMSRAVANYIKTLDQAYKDTGLLTELRLKSFDKDVRAAATSALEAQYMVVDNAEELNKKVKLTSAVIAKWNKWSAISRGEVESEATHAEIAEAFNTMKWWAACAFKLGILSNMKAIESMSPVLLAGSLHVEDLRMLGVTQEVIKCDLYINPSDEPTLEEIISKTYAKYRGKLRMIPTNAKVTVTTRELPLKRGQQRARHTALVHINKEVTLDENSMVW